MKRLGASVLIACACAGLLLACSPEAYSAGAGNVDAIRRPGLDLGGAAVAVDIDKFNQMVVDDWGSR